MNKVIEVTKYLSTKINRIKFFKNNNFKKIATYGILLAIGSTSFNSKKVGNENEAALANLANNSIAFDNNDEADLENDNVIQLDSLMQKNAVYETDSNKESGFITVATRKAKSIKDLTSKEIKKLNESMYTVGENAGILDEIYWEDYTYLKYYLAHPSISMKTAILHVNMGLYIPFGKMYIMNGHSNFDGVYDILLNRYRFLNKDMYIENFDKKSLNEVGNTGLYMQADAAKYLEKMIKDAAKDGIKLKLKSAYISYDKQEKLYLDAVKSLGKEKADLAVPLPGHAYTQIGLGVELADIKKSSDPKSKWISKYGYKYGYVYTAPVGKEHITGYKGSLTGIHFVGTELAKYCHDNNCTFDEAIHLVNGLVTYNKNGKEDYFYPDLGYDKIDDDEIVNDGKSLIKTL